MIKTSTVHQRLFKREEAAYQAHKAEWDEEYKGKWVAVHLGAVVGSNADKTELMKLLVVMQKERGRFRAYLIHIGAPVINVRGPRRLRRLKK